MQPEDIKGLGYVYHVKMMEHHNKIAQIDGLTGRVDTYGDILTSSVRVALKLKEKGIQQNDVVMICSLNYSDTFIPVFATQFLGAVTSGLDPTLSLKDTVHLLQQVPPKIIFIMPEITALIVEALREVGLDIEIVVFGPTKTHTPFSNFLKPSHLEETFRPVEINDRNHTALVLFSSGTTELSKGICINGANFLKSMRMFLSSGHNYKVTMITTSLYWISAHMYLSITILCGFSRILLPKFITENVWKAIDEYKPTYFFAPSLQLIDLANRKVELGGRGESLQHIFTGGVPVYPEHVNIINAGFPNATLFIGYGQTEASIISIFKANNSKDLELLRKYPTSCGKICLGFSYKVVDVETREILGPNQAGELLLKGYLIFNGYYNKESSHMWEDGWLMTGDVVSINKDGCVYIVDRIKEMLKYQSWHVPPAAIEEVLVTHPAVSKCIVIGVPHHLDGDHPMAIVMLKESFKQVTVKEIKEFVNQRVDDRKKLRGGVKIVKQIPVQINGKIKRKTIRDMVLLGNL